MMLIDACNNKIFFLSFQTCTEFGYYQVSRTATKESRGFRQSSNSCSNIFVILISRCILLPCFIARLLRRVISHSLLRSIFNSSFNNVKIFSALRTCSQTSIGSIITMVRGEKRKRMAMAYRLIRSLIHTRLCDSLGIAFYSLFRWSQHCDGQHRFR